MTNRQQQVTVLGAGGRAGRSIVRALVAAGHQVTSVVRDPARHKEPTLPGVLVVPGDATKAKSLVRSLASADAVVDAVTPFSAPPSTFVGFDETFYAGIVEQVLAAHGSSREPRFIAVGLFASLQLPDGRPVRDDPALFPPSLLPFARAHQRRVDALRRTPSCVDWVVAIPPAGLNSDDDVAGNHGYRLSEATMTPPEISSRLGYLQLAAAVADEIGAPSRHRAEVGVLAALRGG